MNNNIRDEEDLFNNEQTGGGVFDKGMITLLKQQLKQLLGVNPSLYSIDIKEIKNDNNVILTLDKNNGDVISGDKILIVDNGNTELTNKEFYVKIEDNNKNITLYTDEKLSDPITIKNIDKKIPTKLGKVVRTDIINLYIQELLPKLNILELILSENMIDYLLNKNKNDKQSGGAESEESQENNKWNNKFSELLDMYYNEYKWILYLIVFLIILFIIILLIIIIYSYNKTMIIIKQRKQKGGKRKRSKLRRRYR